ncbi:hypothetical protein AB4874_02830 [Thioclava sp. 15-R06ZXC-3]|uniref:UrcA family protein n=1 Tax=Thioclava arctica TaxID=3238301 RepID=A0ABV3TGC5_9RHOB
MTRNRHMGFGAVALLLGVIVAGTAGAGDLRQIAPVEVADTALNQITEEITGRAAYDPVAHALAIGLTPERADALVDQAMKVAQSCPLVFDTQQSIAHCWEASSGAGS